MCVRTSAVRTRYLQRYKITLLTVRACLSKKIRLRAAYHASIIIGIIPKLTLILPFKSILEGNNNIISQGNWVVSGVGVSAQLGCGDGADSLSDAGCFNEVFVHESGSELSRNVAIQAAMTNSKTTGGKSAKFLPTEPLAVFSLRYGLSR